jgi:hypothetical protein
VGTGQAAGWTKDVPPPGPLFLRTVAMARPKDAAGTGRPGGGSAASGAAAPIRRRHRQGRRARGRSRDDTFSEPAGRRVVGVVDPLERDAKLGHRNSLRLDTGGIDADHAQLEVRVRHTRT